MKTKINHNTLKRAILSVTLLVSAILGPHSNADRATSMMNVSVLIEYSCSINTTPMSFGDYNGVGANASIALEATATIISNCISGTGAHITLSAGEGKYLVYQVYSDDSRDTVWGNTTPTGLTLTGTGVPQSLTVYGSIPSAQVVPEGDYSDQIYVTISY
jgi:spore coat protein U-like protein